MTPKEISKWLNEDINGRLGLIVEMLYGHMVKPGDSPIDNIIFAVEQNWCEWSVDDKKFVEIVNKILGKMPSAEEWTHLFNHSHQSYDLNQELLRRLGVSMPQAVQTAQSMRSAQPTQGGPAAGVYRNLTVKTVPVGIGKFIIRFHRGTVFTAVAILPSADPNSTTFYVALYPATPPILTGARGGAKNRGKKGRPRAFTRRRGKKWEWYFKVITFKVNNVKEIEVLP